jgi:hypothetical protein
MRYYIDTKYNEHFKQQKCLGFKVGKPIHNIDLISIGIVSEDMQVAGKTFIDMPRKYFAISKDFDIKAAWNSYYYKFGLKGAKYNIEVSDDVVTKKVYYIRETILKSIYKNLLKREYKAPTKYGKQAELAFYKLADEMIEQSIRLGSFTLENFTKLINKYGKTNKQIAREIKEFCTVNESMGNGILNQVKEFNDDINSVVEFHSYYSDYPEILIVKLYGIFKDLPHKFPIYIKSLKQMLDVKVEQMPNVLNVSTGIGNYSNDIEQHPEYPKQKKSYDALSKAIWNKELHKFINNL